MANIKVDSQKLKNETISVRCSNTQKKELEKRADKSHQTVSAYLLEKGLEKRKYTCTAKKKKKAEAYVETTEFIKQLQLHLKLLYADENSYDLLDEIEKGVKKLWDC